MKKPPFVCPVPWQHLEVGFDNNAYLCCHIPVSIGNLQETDPEKLWNSPKAIQIRQSILEGTYEFCRWSTCKFFNQTINQKDPTWWCLYLIVKPETYKQPESPHPLRVSLANERSCNLKCLSCRTSQTNNLQSSQASLVWNNLRKMIGRADLIKANGSGEFWINPTMKDFVASQLHLHPKLQLEILTNATVLNASEYLISKFVGRTSLIYVSVDAATKETYRLVRGGNFNNVMSNLESLAKLKVEQNDPKNVVMSFVVSSTNFHEILKFSEWATKIKIPATFSRIQDWGHLGARFNTLDISSSQHPQHKNLVSILKKTKDQFPETQLNELESFTAY